MRWRSVCRAGIRPIMITGDHPLTARHIAASSHSPTVMRFITGQELDRMTAGERTAGRERSDGVRV